MGFLGNLFGGGIVKSIENIALEAIETDKESAEAKAVLLKAIDPNGAMRRQISQTVSDLYKMYIIAIFVLIIMQSFKIGDVDGVTNAIKNLVELFLPITGAFTTIVGASFGVNYANVKKGI